MNVIRDWKKSSSGNQRTGEFFLLIYISFNFIKQIIYVLINSYQNLVQINQITNSSIQLYNITFFN